MSEPPGANSGFGARAENRLFQTCGLYNFPLRRIKSDFTAARFVARPPAGRLFTHPAQKANQLRRPPQLFDGRIQDRQSAIGIGGMDHAVTLVTEKYTEQVGRRKV